ncbi:MAG TPA: ATP-binding protein [Vicinamibacterales bacterium]|jgi:PAS domain S-box-containing protein|nr:ATP-binding protein [Vicinamibacterales bacterium]
MVYRRQFSLHAALTVAVAALGFALNSGYIESLVRAWPGRAVTLPVAVLFGPWLGALAAAVSAWPATHSHPGLMALFVIEALVLGVATARLRTPLVARLLVALLLAASVVAFPGIHGLDALTWRTIPVAFERVLVLLVAPVLSDLVVAAVVRLRPDLSRDPGPRPLRALIRHAFVLAAVLPILIVSTVSGEFFSARQHEEADARLNDTAVSLAERVNSYVDAHVSGIAALAASLDMGTVPSQLELVLERQARIYPDFSAVAIADASGVVQHIQPLSFRRPGLSVGDRPFFSDAVNRRPQVAISDVTPSPLTGAPLVFLGAAILTSDGRLTGVAHASLRLTAFQYFVESYLTLPNSTVVMLDRTNRVIYTSPGLGHRNGDDLSESPMVRQAAGATMDHAYSYDPDGDGERTVQLGARAVMATTGWTVYVQQPEVVVASDVPVYFLITLALVFVALLASAVGARLFAATVTAPLEELVGFMRHLSLGTAETLPLPAQAPAEIVALTRDVNGMQHRLRESYAQLERALADGEGANHNLEQLTEMLEEKVEQRTSELTTTTQFLENVLAALPGALFVSDGQGQIHLCNEAASTLVGRPVSELTGSPLGAVFAWQHVDDGESPIVRGEGTLLTASGERVPVLLSSAQLATQAPARVGAIHIAIDIRDRKQLEMELQQAQKLESVGRLAAGVAHEINTPAQFVSDSVQFLKEGLSDLFVLVARYRDLHRTVLSGGPVLEKAAEVSEAEREADLEYLIDHVPGAIDRSIDGLGRVTAIVKSMKDFAHPDRKEMVAVDLNQGIRSTLIIAKNEYKYVAAVEAHYGELPPVICHGGDINQVVLNIIVNAAHAIGDVVAGTSYRGRIGIETCREGDWAVIRISDTGGGIPEAIRGHVFDPFFTTKGVGKGTGQGLAIARTIVADRHHGQVSFETEPGHGTTFTIKLPIKGPRSEAAA